MLMHVDYFTRESLFELMHHEAHGLSFSKSDGGIP
jgi:hypothetical protein